MKVNKIVILEDDKDEERKIKKVCNKLVEKKNIKYEVKSIRNEKHCDAIIYGEIDNKKIAVLLEITGRNITQEDYQDKPDNTKKYLEEENIMPIPAIYSEGFGTLIAKIIPKNILRMTCRSNKTLCEYL